MLSIGIDLGGTKLRVGLMNEEGKLLFDKEVPTAAERGPAPIIQDMIQLVSMARSVAEGPVMGIGIGSPGPLNPKTGVILSPPNLPGWDRVPIQTLVAEATGLPVYLENDANVACLAEHRFGAGVGSDDMLYFTVSTGIGGGAIVNGRLVQGAIGAAAEFGHTVVDLHGPLCRCGNRGCLEAIASGTGIAARAEERLGTKTSPFELNRLALEGNDEARQILDDAFYALGVGVANMITVFDPEVVVIGGGVAQIGERMFQRVRQVAATQSFRDKNEVVSIVPAELERNSGVVGAASVPFVSLNE